MPKNELKKQSLIFTNYLIGKKPSRAISDLYAKAIDTSESTVSLKDNKLLKYAVEHPRAIGFIDSGLAIINPESEVRRRLYLLLAILESSPDYWDDFLSKKRSPLFLVVILYCCLRAVIKAVLGLILVEVVS